MNRTVKKIAVGSAFALFASTTLTGVASAQTGSLGSAGLGSAAPAYTSPHKLAENPGETCAQNYFESTEKWEINWGFQHSDTAKGWTSDSFGGLTYIDPQYATKTPAQELAIIQAADKAAYQWYPSVDMVSNGAELTLGFEDGDVILGEVLVGNDNCPSVRWTHFPADGSEADTTTPDDFPEGAPAPTKPAIPSDSATDSPFGSLGSLFAS